MLAESKEMSESMNLLREAAEALSRLTSESTSTRETRTDTGTDERREALDHSVTEV